MRLAPIFLALAACDGGIVKDTAPDGDDSGTTTPDTDTTPTETGDTAEPVEPATITGTVQVRLTTTDEDGNVVDLSWDDATGGVFAYGSIFVAAYTQDDTTGELTTWGSTVIASPSVDGDTFAVEVNPAEVSTVYLYAALDYWVDGVIGTTEPIGTWPDAVAVPVDTATTGGDDVAITIVAPWLTGGGGDGTYVDVTGGVNVTGSFDQGDARVMLYDTAGNGPYYTSAAVPLTGDGTGAATGSYALSVGAGFGAANLRAAWDSNHNGLVDPTDAWGAYASAPGTEGNPVTVGSDALSGYDVEIPLGQPPTITPNVSLQGDLGFREGFDTLPEGSTVYAVAMRRRPSTDVTVSSLADDYDVESFSGATLTGDRLYYRLIVPANTTVFLYGFIDMDGDGVVNEPGEPAGSYAGGVSSGNVPQTGLDFRMDYITE